MDLQSTRVFNTEQMGEQLGLLPYEEINKLFDILKCWKGKAKGWRLGLNLLLFTLP